MPNQRDSKKKLVGYFATEREKQALKELAEIHGYGSVAELLRAIAKRELPLPEPENKDTPKEG